MCMLQSSMVDVIIMLVSSQLCNLQMAGASQFQCCAMPLFIP